MEISPGLGCLPVRGIRRKLSIAAALASLVLVVAGCNTSDVTYKSTGPDTNCPQGSRMEAATGQKLSDGSRYTDDRSVGGVNYRTAGCAYIISGSGDSISVARVDPQDSSDATFQALQHAAQSEADVSRFEPVGGVGRAARMDGQRLVVFTGSMMVFVQVKRDQGDPQPLETKLARALLAAGTLGQGSANCDGMAPQVTQTFGAFQDRAEDVHYEKAGGAQFEAVGCRYLLSDNGYASVMTAAGSYWQGWLGSKSAAIYRAYLAAQISGRPAFSFDDTLIIADPKAPIEVRVITPTNDDIDVGGLQRAAAELMVSLTSSSASPTSTPRAGHT